MMRPIEPPGKVDPDFWEEFTNRNELITRSLGKQYHDEMAAVDEVEVR